MLKSFFKMYALHKRMKFFSIFHHSFYFYFFAFEIESNPGTSNYLGFEEKKRSELLILDPDSQLLGPTSETNTRSM